MPVLIPLQRQTVSDKQSQDAIEAVTTTIRTILGLLSPFDQVDPWHKLTLATGWVAHSSTYFEPGYTKTPLGRVELRGAAKSGSGLITSLPKGYWPVRQVTFPIVTNTGFGQLTIDTFGGVTLTSGGNTLVSLDGVFFDTRS